MIETAESRVEAIAAELRAQILNGKYGPGERLPSERELSERMGVNRASAREALKKLEQLGMVTIRRGGGARVVPLEEAGLGVLRHVLGGAAPKREIVSQWLDVHELVISGAARFAMERGTPEEIAQAKRLLRRLCDISLSNEQHVVVVDELTDLIARASRNVVLRMVRDGLTSTAKRRDDKRKLMRAPRKLLLPIVRDIERAMDARDADAAEASVRRLLRENRPVVLDMLCGPEAQA
ncbi:MAG TPA: GntR family transcriptional regulator [Polyangiales bacterium]|jgi:GntR family transcriptional repressor for pyruvate dehydrogenase complex|nr:GntR family transcriptional regulator [Polyangiales bacterium]